MVGNIDSIARGVGKAAETAHAYFGSTLAGVTRVNKFANLTGNSKAGRLNKDTFSHKLMRMFKRQTALILTYDNYQ